MFFRYRKLTFLLLFCLCFTSKVYAQDIEFTASLNKTRVSLEERIVLSLEVIGARNIDPPKLPPLDDFDVFSAGSSSRINIINGRYSATKNFSFVLVPLKEGEFTIGPAVLEYDGREYKTKPLNVIVQKASVSSSNKVLPPGPAAAGAAVNAAVKTELDKKVFVELVPDKKEVFLGEQLVLTFKFYRSQAKVANIQYVPPETKYFIEEELAKQRNYRKQLKERVYDVIELKTALFPVRTGKLVISPAKIRCDLLIKQGRQKRRRPSVFEDFFNDSFFDDPFFSSYLRKPLEISSEPVEIQVKPHPVFNKPEDFKGAVGNFNLQVTAEPVTLKAGEPITLRMVVNGCGNIKSIAMPEVAELDTFKSYEPESKISSVPKGNKIYGQKVFEKVLVPKQAGVQTIPPVSFSFFNPEKVEYKSITSEPIEIKVAELPPEEKQALPRIVESTLPETGPAKKTIELYSRDINFIKEELADFKEKGDFLYNNSSFWLINIFPSFFLVLLWGYKKREERFKTDVGYARLKVANKVFTKKLKEAKKTLRRNKAQEFYEIINKAMQEYLGNKLNIPSGGITSNVALEQLDGKQIPTVVKEEVKSLFEACDMAKFSASSFSQEDMKQLWEKAEKTFALLDKKL